MPTNHVLSASVLDALEAAIFRGDVESVADAFAEMYVLAQMGVGKESYARGVDEIACRTLNRETGQ